MISKNLSIGTANFGMSYGFKKLRSILTSKNYHKKLKSISITMLLRFKTGSLSGCDCCD